MLRPLLLLLSSRDQQALPMAVDLFPENWATWEPAPPCPNTVISSPGRISFSCDLDSAGDDDDQPAPRSNNFLITVDGSPSSSSEFDFCAARGQSEQESSAAADDLFSDGVLLPLCLLYRGGSTTAATPTRLDALISNRNGTSPTTVATGGGTSTTVARSKSSGGGGGPLKCVFVPTTPKADTNKKEKQKEAVAAPVNSAAIEHPNVHHPLNQIRKQSSSFWRFRRSSSLNSGEGAAAGGRRSSLICSFSVLSRSKSAGCNPVPVAAKPRPQQHHLSAASTPAPANALSSSSSGKLSRKGSANGGSGPRNMYYYGQKQHGGAGVRISPVLNVPSPSMPRGGSARLLSFGHLLCSVKEKRRKN